MKLTKSQLEEMILQEIRISFGSFLEEGELGNAGEEETSNMSGQIGLQYRANLGSDATMAQISEDDDSDDELTLEDQEVQVPTKKRSRQ